MDEAERVDHLADVIAASRRIVVFTGAGVSTESGIPDFRSPTGLWSQIRPITFQEFVKSETARRDDWRRRFASQELFAEVEPNITHRFVAALVEEGRCIGVITQNIDGLHARAGVPEDRLVELHGNGTYAHCLDCGRRVSLVDARKMMAATTASPRCTDCGGLVKAAVISFGEAMPESAMRRAGALADDCDLFLVLGSSLVVQPAASIPLHAKARGATLVLVNREPTALDGYADLCIYGELGKTVAGLQ